ncbi:protein-tyrosine sulfotransferase 1-like isoform X1 [Homarus americanus]|uniref:protein-tyrosine sulfotransferase 1-like isoform X1 n=2 Tax=Homarus americanus TaxID=6706 RepID=UPI001C4804F6|nr:protein-tyrosine sulfotransferase 1-like isoform X1 [Homarus americanus]XP_042226929.1 protein-tyrosine sulfotransferase 1-like isoform X1 [Homarus americanus]XP_042226930.1 protein-tyrosine sulfotransferase 1-like isoform X1 [Homarus americanus]XP_042226931.1 protein-tyrosine sulfotransferase 1-like isoform X1 [Homarus americanus]XP_042226932.1 protein-tyrosine sulfotransferase 1-like isoform X1 [Homarus americanus]XP_042226933.1 protein-tyrosine sulfotransferase 1-like isoform X1 [Homarus
MMRTRTGSCKPLLSSSSLPSSWYRTKEEGEVPGGPAGWWWVVSVISLTPHLVRYVVTAKCNVVMWRMMRRYLPHAVVGAFILVLIYRSQRPCQETLQRPHKQHVASDSSGALHNYDRSEPMIFIGGMPRSGTTLARAMLDAHPDIRCGEETRVVPRILQMRQQWKRSAKEALRLQEAGVTDEVLDEAISSFILDIVVNHGQPAARLCNKDPFTLKSATYLSKLFPNAKFLFMVRDGRATVHSIISRKVTITGFDLSSYKQCLQRWNSAVQTMNTQCDELGSTKCLPVYYEQLVLHPQEWMRKILDFLGVDWDDSVLHHEEHINKPGGVSLSKVERSSDQVIKPINLDALSKWVGQIPKDVVEDMANIAPMLATLGYDPYSNPPNYGQADALVANNTKRIQKELSKWEDRAEEVRSISKHRKGDNT